MLNLRGLGRIELGVVRPRRRGRVIPNAAGARRIHESRNAHGLLENLVIAVTRVALRDRVGKGRGRPRLVVHLRLLLQPAILPRSQQVRRPRAHVGILLEARDEKVVQRLRHALRKGRVVVGHDPEERLHRLQVVVRGLAGDQLDDRAAHAPDVARLRWL
eukprot:scaffold7063_cov351-Pinguiococcus_pyrenoidosus.AAC.7